VGRWRVRREGIELWVFNGGELAMIREKARSEGVGCADVRVKRLRKYRAEHAVGRQEAMTRGTKTHVSWACRRASLIIRPGA
jgi:hypothetical protein